MTETPAARSLHVLPSWNSVKVSCLALNHKSRNGQTLYVADTFILGQTEVCKIEKTSLLFTRDHQDVPEEKEC